MDFMSKSQAFLVVTVYKLGHKSRYRITIQVWKKDSETNNDPVLCSPGCPVPQLQSRATAPESTGYDFACFWKAIFLPKNPKACPASGGKCFACSLFVTWLFVLSLNY
jgi:hypothetical protein